MKDWYNGYKSEIVLVGGGIDYVDKYNVWSVVNYLNSEARKLQNTR
jgi:hypothetical protein